MALGWRRSEASGYHYFGDDKYDYGYAHRTPDGREWYATVYAKLLERQPRLKDAKKLVEREVRKTLRPRSKKKSTKKRR